MYENISPNAEVVQNKSSSLDIARVFLYMFCGLLITFVVAVAGGYLLARNGSNNAVIAVSVVGAIVMLIDVIFINVSSIRGKNILVPGIIYAISVGLTFTALVLALPWQLLGMAFGITCLTFLIMSLIAFISKGNLSPLLTVALGLMSGAAILALICWIFILFNPSLATPLVWVVSFAVFGFCLLITIYDLWNIKKIAEAGAMNNNLALYCAFSIYVDFINLFLRILYYLIIIFGRSNR